MEETDASSPPITMYFFFSVFVSRGWPRSLIDPGANVLENSCQGAHHPSIELTNTRISVSLSNWKICVMEYFVNQGKWLTKMLYKHVDREESCGSFFQRRLGTFDGGDMITSSSRFTQESHMVQFNDEKRAASLWNRNQQLLHPSWYTFSLASLSKENDLGFWSIHEPVYLSCQAPG